MMSEKSTRIAMLKMIRVMMEMVEWSYIDEEKKRYEGGFVPEDGSLQSDDTHSIVRAVNDLIEREDSDE